MRTRRSPSNQEALFRHLFPGTVETHSLAEQMRQEQAVLAKLTKPRDIAASERRIAALRLRILRESLRREGRS